jgi:hypothetical protein
MDMDMGYDVMWLPVLEGVVGGPGGLDGWNWTDGGRSCGWEEGGLRRVLLVWRKESMSMVVSMAREGLCLLLDLEGFFPFLFLLLLLVEVVV